MAYFSILTKLLTRQSMSFFMLVFAQARDCSLPNVSYPLVLQKLDLEVADMSPACKSKSKDKKPGKESPKNSLKHVSTSTGTSGSGYNPILGTFHTFETSPTPSSALLHVNGRFRNIDETEDHNRSSSGTGIEYDSISNNGSWSGDSEDHKEKPSNPLPRQDTIPGADNDKREKVRQKNERKHQRQKERRAQELHEKCSGYLMSRKLEALAQKLVVMGFSQERATMALILNEGRVEESVAWLLEGSEEDKTVQHNIDEGGNLKIDISEELARVTELEIRYKASKQEVERAIVSSEGDLDKAEETIKSQKEDPPFAPCKANENGDPPTVATNQNSLRIQSKSTSPTAIQQKREEKEYNYIRSPAVGSSVDSKVIQVMKKLPPKTDWARTQQIPMPAEKRWVSSGSNPSSSSLASPPTASPVKELKNLQLGSVKEPVIVMQRPQSINSKQASSTSISSSPYTISVETAKQHGFVPSLAVSRSISPNGISSNQSYTLQAQYKPSQQQQFVSNSSSMDSSGAKSRLPALAPPSSLGLFSGIGTSAINTPSQVDWTTGSSTLQFDYTNIDWSLDRGSLLSRPNYVQSNGFGYGVNSSSLRSGLSKGNGAVTMVGLQDRLSGSEAIVGGSREWTSPFEEKELFSVTRQFVSSPTL